MLIRLAAAALAVSVLACSPAAEKITTPDAVTVTETAQPAVADPVPADLIGSKWRLTHFDRAEAAPEAIIITLRFDADKISGNAGCNNFFAGLTEGDRPGDITIGAAGATRMACPEEIMNAESRFLDALAHVVRYDLVGERLALTYRHESEHHTLLLNPVDAGT